MALKVIKEELESYMVENQLDDEQKETIGKFANRYYREALSTWGPIVFVGGAIIGVCTAGIGITTWLVSKGW